MLRGWSKKLLEIAHTESISTKPFEFSSSCPSVVWVSNCPQEISMVDDRKKKTPPGLMKTILPHPKFCSNQLSSISSLPSSYSPRFGFHVKTCHLDLMFEECHSSKSIINKKLSTMKVYEKQTNTL
jgi:hypothetical protein